MVSQTLFEQKEAIYLSSPQAEMIWKGDKNIIVKSKLFRAEIDKLLYLIDETNCYGIIKLHNPEKITVDEFSKLQEHHKLSDESRHKWWPGKEILFAYKFDNINMFEKPMKISVSQTTQTFTDFEFLNVEEILIKDISNYVPSKMTDAQLSDDWRIVCAWYATKKSGGKFKYSIEDIINLAGIIYREIIKRVDEGKMKHEFKPDEMQNYTKELYNIVSKGKTGIENSDSPKYELSDPNLLKYFDDKIIIKNFICVMGSYANHSEDYVPKDIDLLIKMQAPNDYIRRAVETRICKDLGFSDKIHFVWGDLEGPHDTYIPLYDLQLKKINPLVKVTMQQETIELAEGPFYPMKPSKRFYQIDELLKYMFPNGKYVLEKKFNGFRGLLVKRGSNVNLYSDQKRDIGKHFEAIRNEASRLSSKNIIIDGELVYGDGGRSEIAKYVTGKSNIDDSKITFYVFDIIEYDKDISHQTWNNRKQTLHSLHFTPHIKETASIIVDNSSEASKAVNLLRNLKGSEGAMIKRYEGLYTKNGESDAWIKFRNEDTIIVKVIDVTKKENGYTYNMGIVVPKEKFKESYLNPDELLILGNTFVSTEKFSVGDKIAVNIEEVWRHEYPDGKIRYSVHKPKVMGSSDKPLSTWEHLDELAVSKGESVTEHSESLCRQCGLCCHDKIMLLGGGCAIHPTRKCQHLGDDNKCKVYDDRFNVNPACLNLTKMLSKNYVLPEGCEYAKLNPEYKCSKVITQAELDVYTLTQKGLTTTETKGIKSISGTKETEKIEGPEEQELSEDEFEYIDLSDETTQATPGVSGVQGKIISGYIIKKKFVKDNIDESTRAEASDSFWKSNWQNMYPSDGKGRFVYHHHWRGLTEEEAKTQSNEGLLNTNHSLHGDLRFEKDAKELYGFTVFTGTAEENKSAGEDKLIYESEHNTSPTKLQGTFKLPQPHGWLDVGSGKGTISSPKGVGATTKKFAKFFKIDSGTYDIGVWREHMFELFMHGDKLKGRMIIAYAPVGEGGRKWLVDFPNSQEPYIDSHNKEEIIKELHSKGQKWLIWSKPGQKPERIEVK